MSEEDNSLSSPGPLSPPTNNKRIDSYFTPKDVVRTDSKSSLSRNLFGGKVITDTNSTQGTEVLQTPPQSTDSYPQSISLLPTTVSNTQLPGGAQPSMLDQRSKDIHILLMSKDTRIKELEHVCIFPRFSLGIARCQKCSLFSESSPNLHRIAARRDVAIERGVQADHRIATNTNCSIHKGASGIQGKEFESLADLDHQVCLLSLQREATNRVTK